MAGRWPHAWAKHMDSFKGKDEVDVSNIIDSLYASKAFVYCSEFVRLLSFFSVATHNENIMAGITGVCQQFFNFSWLSILG